MPKLPQDCMTMADVRGGVDSTDRELMALLSRRFDYMRAAARIKPDRSSVRDEARKATVIEAAVSAGRSGGIPAEIVAHLWEDLVEASIAFEMDHWDGLNP